MPIVTAETLMDELSGLKITGGEINNDGMHLYLDDGRVLIMEGAFIVGLARVERMSLQ